MEDIFKDDEFAQFIINDYLGESDMTNIEKLLQVGSSVEEYTKTMECLKLSRGTIRKH